MREKININQMQLIKIAPKIKPDLAVVLCHLIGWHDSQSEKVEKERIKGYTWIDYETLKEDLPILQINTVKSVKDKLDKLQELGLIKLKNFRVKGKDRKYFILLPICNRLRTYIQAIKQDVDFASEIYDILIDSGVEKGTAIAMAFDEEFVSSKKETLEEARLTTEDQYNNKKEYLKCLYVTFCKERKKRENKIS